MGCLSLCTDNADEQYARNYLLNKVLIKAMAEYCREREIQFMLVVGDMPTYLPEIEKRRKVIDSTFNENFFDDDMKEFAGSIDVEYAGLQRMFRKSFEETGTYAHWGDWKFWGHWNYEGHRLVADILSTKLRQVIDKDTLEKGN